MEIISLYEDEVASHRYDDKIKKDKIEHLFTIKNALLEEIY